MQRARGFVGKAERTDSEHSQIQHSSAKLGLSLVSKISSHRHQDQVHSKNQRRTRGQEIEDKFLGKLWTPQQCM